MDRRLAFAMILLSGPASIIAAAQTTIHINVNQPRALEAALDRLEKTLGVPINYEDPRLACSGDVEDVTSAIRTSGQRAANPNARIIVPKAGSLSMDFILSATPGLAEAVSIATLLRVQHEANGSPGRFAVKQVGSVITVEPSAVRMSDCSWNTTTPAMETRISFASQTRTATDTLPIILNALSQRLAVKVGLANLPMIAFVNRSVTLGANDEPANIVLGHLFEQLSSPGQVFYSYHMFYDPGLKYYMVDIDAVPPITSLPQTGSTPASAPPPVGTFGAKPVRK